jgi:carboxymethylenebutenolidase
VVVLLQEAFGVTENLVDIADRLAGEGFAAVAPELYHRRGDRIVCDYAHPERVGEHAVSLTDEGILSDLRAVLAWIAAQPRLDSERVSAMGFCLGGRAAFLAATSLPLVSAISFYGSGIVSPLDAWGLTSLLHRVDALRCPVLFCFGLTDPTIPPADIETLRRTLREHGRLDGGDFEIAAYEVAGHGFFCDARAAHHPAAAADAWWRSLRLLRRATTTAVGESSGAGR